MIEVEIRAKITDDQFNKLSDYFLKNGKLIEKHSREMYLLYDYPGYDADPTKRDVDIRLRNTDGFCEIMVKHKAAEGNTARREVSLPIKDTNLETAKQIVKAFGCKRALRMIREKQIFDFSGIEWSLVNCPPKNLKFYEAEIAVEDPSSIPAARKKLIEQATLLGLEVLNNEQMREFIFWLDREVNVEIEL